MRNSKRFVNLVSLVVLVATNILSPLSYVTAEDDLDIGDTASYGAEQDSGGDSSATPQNDDSTPSGTEGRNLGDAEENTQDSSATPQNDNSTPSGTEGRNLGDAEEDTQDSSATPQNDEGDDADNPSVTDVTAPLTGSETLQDDLPLCEERGTACGGEVHNETPMDSSADKSSSGGQDEVDNGTGEKSAIDELKELIENEENSIQIVESEEIYGTGEYEGVKVEVYAQTGAFPLGTILNIIPITGDDEMSDIQDVLEQQKNVEKSQKVIAFDIIFLDPETEKELQPLMTGAVQVTFNYEENDELVAAEENEEQEVKVYHLNDKDEEGEKIENITGTIVEDILINEEASEEVENGLVIDAESFSVYVVTVTVNFKQYDLIYSDTLQHVTIQGEDDGMNDFYYGTITIPVEGGADIVIMDRNLGANAKWNTGTYLYGTAYEDVRYTDNDFYGYYYKWGNNQGFRADATHSNDSWAAHSLDSWNIDNQGPCPDGWHVPTSGEWSSVITQLNVGDDKQGFLEALLLPPAGRLIYKDYSAINVGSTAYYWSSSISGKNAYAFASYNLSNGASDPVSEYPVRCLKNTPQIFTITLNANGGELEGESSLTTDNEGKVTLPRATREPNENGERVFEGWFASTGVSEKIGNSGDIITPTADMDVYAHWAQTISIWDPTNSLSGFTIMDRNLGAIMTGAGPEAKTGSYGFHYQWGNNYGFDANIDPSELTTSSVKVNVSGLTSYYSGTFITTNKTGDPRRQDTWMETDNNDLWNGDQIQGPCPDGWHIPSVEELDNLLIYWAKSNNVTWSSNHVKINSGHSKISDDLYIPYAGARNYDASFLNRGDLGIFWSYSINGSNGLPYDFFTTSTSNPKETYVRNYDGRIRGISVRCFRDEYVVQCPEGEEYVESEKKCSPSRAIIRDSESGEIIQINDMEWDDLELYFLKSDGSTGHYTIMDRNMGATEVYNQNQDNPNFESLGYHYQRGNNYGFKPCEGTDCTLFPGGETKENIVVEKSVWETYAPSKYARNTWSTAENWMGGYSSNDNLWGGAGDDHYSNGLGTAKDRQGPCPDGYHIPSAYEWKQMSDDWEYSIYVDMYLKGDLFGSDFLLPSVGYRSYSNGQIYNRFIAMYRSSSPIYDSQADRLSVNGYGPGVFNMERSMGLSLRCMRNSNNADTLQIHANGGTGAVIAFTGSVSNGRFTSLGTPRKGNDVFLGWYDAPVDGNKLETGSAVVPDIYARWVVNVTFNSKGGSGIPSQTINLGEHATKPTDPTRDNSEFKWWYLEDPSTAFDFEHTAITGNITLNAKWECNEGYIQKGNSCVESVVVTFNSKGGTPKQSVEIEKGTKLKGNDVKYSHTSNIDDAGTNNGYYDDNLEILDVVKFPGSERLYVDLKYATETNYDYLVVLEGEYSGGEPNMPYNFFYGDSSDELNTTGFYVDGDVVTFLFYSNDSVGYYGYYAVISGFYDKIGDDPIRNGYTFTGWYTEPQGGVKFDPETTSITENMTLYAHWESNCPEGQEYAETDEQCYPSRAIIRDSESGEIIQINDQKWDDLELYFLGDDDTNVPHYTIMDRNLGATRVYNQNWNSPNTDSFGYHYQWGNNYGFQSCLTKNCQTFPGGEDKDNSLVPQSIYGKYIPSQYARNIWFYEGNNFIEQKTWMDNGWNGDGIWGGTGDKYNSNGTDTTKPGRRGPCPEGYYIPSTNDWGDMYDAWTKTTPNTSNIGIQFASDWLMPAAGVRSRKDAKVENIKSEAYYRSSSPNESEAIYARSLDLESIRVNPGFSAYRSQGGLVRCAKNSPNSNTLTLHANGGTKAVIAFTGTVGDGKFTALGTPTRSNSTFSGWYDAEVLGNKLETGSTVVSDIYARWSCKNGYTEVNGECIQQFTCSAGQYLAKNTSSCASCPAGKYCGGGTYEFNASTDQGITSCPDLYISDTGASVENQCYKALTVTFTIQDTNAATKLGGSTGCNLYYGSSNCSITSPSLTANEGYSALGWDTDKGATFSSLNSNTSTTISENTTYYSITKSNDKVLHISYTKGIGVEEIGETSDSCTLTGTYNGALQATSCIVTLPEIILRSGYGTGVWTKNTNSSVTKKPGDSIELTSNDSYTASAIATVYPISYHENGGTLVGQKTSYTVEEDFTLVTPNRDSYVFEGWTGSNGDNPQKTVTVNSGTVTGPLNYYANWTPITYTIAFNGNAVNVEGTQSSMDATYDSGDTAPESNFTRPGYTFTSWNTQSDGNGIEYHTGSELMNLSTVSGDVVTLYAIWQANTDTPYTVHYYLENIDDENYTFDSTDGKAGTTDDEISIDTLKKEITGAHFEKAAVVVSNQGPEYGATTTVDNITISGDGNTEVYLFYKRNTHTVTAIAGEGVGSVSGAGTYKYGQTVTLTPGNINSCYTANSKTFTMPDNDVQETLNGVIKKFTVTLNKDSHISSVQGAGEYNCGVEVNVSATPNVGYEFVRWEKNSTQVSTQSSYTFTITESVVLNAVSKAQNGITYTVRHWIRDIGANTYTKYSEESKSGETDSPITLENEKISVPCGTYAEGKENGTVKTTTTIKGDGSTVIDLYYSRNSYIVTTSKDSGILSVSNSASHECGAGVTITATPKTGYSFNRYSSTDVDSSTNNPYTFTMPDKAVSIQAQSNANTYTVNFNANGGTGTMSQQTFTYDISQQLSDNLFTRTGYIFTGWSIDSGATVPTYTNKQSVDNLATTGSITLYAIWTTKGTSTKYTVRHIKQGLSTPTDDVVETQELYAETNSVQTPAVNTYSGFNSPSVGNITVSANGNASIDYVYTRKNITLTLDKDNGTQNSTITGKYGANVQKPTSNPSKSGYTFAGWLPNIPDTFPVINGTHVAQYTLDTYTITYNLNGGINHADNPTSYTYLSGDITLKAPTRDGYVFNGWVGTDVNSVTKTVIISSHSEGNRSYTAIWGEDRNNNGVDDDSEPKYTVTINYVYSRGGTVAGSYTIGNQLSGFTYNVDSPIIVNYHADKTNVSGTITGNVNETVTYTPDHDTNNNGIADEEEPTNNSGGSSSGGGSGGGGGGSGGGAGGNNGNQKTPEKDIHGSADVKVNTVGDEGDGPDKADNTDLQESPSNEVDGQNKSDSSESNKNNSSQNNPTYSEEFNQAYSFAYSKGITTVPTIQAANLNSPLTRIQMAKMLSYFAINVLGKKPDTTKKVKFRDVTAAKNKQYDNGVTLAYQLGIMGINMKNNKFRPNDLVTRAEFVTALSRLLYNTDDGEYKGTSKYYKPHMDNLYNEGIITKTNPKMEENRGYVMIMLMRSAEGSVK